MVLLLQILLLVRNPYFKAFQGPPLSIHVLNKVLEHVDDPAAMLAKAKDNLDPGGLVYIELPDAEHASVEGKGREEFFIDHIHVFSTNSVKHLAGRAGFETVLIETLQEPSTKYTIRAFLKLIEK